MKIDKTLNDANRVLKMVEGISAGKRICDISIFSIGNVINNLKEIIAWYDRNQRRLVKTLICLARENKNLKMDIVLLADKMKESNPWGDMDDPA